MIRIINAETGEVIERELNIDELSQQAIDDANELTEREIKAAEAEAKAEAKAALLERLGITEAEAKLLLA